MKDVHIEYIHMVAFDCTYVCILEKGMATHCSIPAWRIPRTEEPGGLQSMVSQESDTTEGLIHTCVHTWGFPGGTGGKKKKCRRHQRLRFNPWVRKIPWRRAWRPTPEFLPGEFHGQRSLAGYSP